MSNTGPLDPITSPQDWLNRLRQGRFDIAMTRRHREAHEKKIKELEKKVAEDKIKEDQRAAGRSVVSKRRGRPPKKDTEAGNTV